MTAWMKSTFHFARRVMQLELSRQDLVNLGLHRDMDAAVEDAGLLEASLRIIIEQERPELAGCVLHSMGFDHSDQIWYVMIEHPAIPAVPLYENYPSERLIRERPQSNDPVVARLVGGPSDGETITVYGARPHVEIPIREPLEVAMARNLSGKNEFRAATYFMSNRDPLTYTYHG